MNISKNELDTFKKPPISITSPNPDIIIEMSNKSQTQQSPQSLSQTQTYNTLLSQLDIIDKSISEYIFTFETNAFIEWCIFLFARLFNPDIMICCFVLIFLYNIIRYKMYFVIVKPLVHVIVCLVFTLISKYLIKRERPEMKEGIIRRHNCRKKEKNFSMPSGDSMQAASFGVVCLCYCDSAIGFLVVPFVMLARIFYYCHYFFDTVVGMVCGIVVSGLVYVVINLFSH